MMWPGEVFLELQKLKSSIYYGYTIADIANTITITEGYRYLTELSILNEKEKSGLETISDRSSNQETDI